MEEPQLRQSPTEPLDSFGKTWHTGSFKNRGFSLRNFAHVPLVLVLIFAAAVTVAVLLLASVGFFKTLSDLLSVFVAFCAAVFTSVSLPLPPMLEVVSWYLTETDSLKCIDFMGFLWARWRWVAVVSSLGDGVGDSFEGWLSFSALILHTVVVQSWAEGSVYFQVTDFLIQILTVMWMEVLTKGVSVRE